LTSNPTYFSEAPGLIRDAADNAQFGQLVLEGGVLNWKRQLSPRSAVLMASEHTPDGPPGLAEGRGFGRGVQAVSEPPAAAGEGVSGAVAAGYRVSQGSFGWDGAFGTHVWVDPKEKIVGVMMVQTDNPNRQMDRDFETR